MPYVQKPVRIKLGIPPAFRRFLKCTSGNASIELVLWLPLLVTIIVFILDVSLAMHAHARMWDVARDAARSVVMGTATEAEAEANIRNILRTGTYTVDVDASVGNRVQVTIGLKEAGLDFGVFDVTSFSNMQAIYTMRKEI